MKIHAYLPTNVLLFVQNSKGVINSCLQAEH